ncbi:unnamed protein product, partial [Ectocarpus sp. 6 AP-2014]
MGEGEWMVVGRRRRGRREDDNASEVMVAKGKSVAMANSMVDATLGVINAEAAGDAGGTPEGMPDVEVEERLVLIRRALCEGRESGSLLVKGLAKVAESSTPKQVFGCGPGDVLPTSSNKADFASFSTTFPGLLRTGTLNGGRRIDVGGTAALPKEVRQSFEARHVEADGHCPWRAMAMSFLGCESHWRRLKLVVLANAAVRVEQICGLVPVSQYDLDIWTEHSK